MSNFKNIINNSISQKINQNYIQFLNSNFLQLREREIPMMNFFDYISVLYYLSYGVKMSHKKGTMRPYISLH